MYYIVKAMSLWNWVKEKQNDASKALFYFYYYVTDYFYNTHNKWTFHSGYPVSMNNVNNVLNDNKWVYNATTNTLIYQENNIKCGFSWLSAKLVINDNEIKDYDIDDFLNTLQIYTVNNHPPTLTMVFMMWCIHTKQWFSSSAAVEFHIINDIGDEQVLYTQFNTPLAVRDNKLY